MQKPVFAESPLIGQGSSSMVMVDEVEMPTLGKAGKGKKSKACVEEMVEMPMYRGEIDAAMFYKMLNSKFDEFLEVFEARQDKDTIIEKLNEIDEEFTDECFVQKSLTDA